jgi:outer membrane protein assembly factor BamB
VRAFSTPLYDEFGDPIVVDVVVYISDSTDGSLQAINGVTGAVDWTLQNPCGGGTSDPAFASGNVWMGSDDPGFAGISPSGVGVYCITADDFYGSPPVAGGGSVYASGENEELAAMDAVTGKLRWVEGGATTTSPGYGWPTLNSAGTDVYVSGGTAASDIDDINELNAATGAVIWSSPIGCSWPTIADDGSVLYVGGSCGLFAVSAATGTIQWHSSSSLASNFGPPVIAGNLIIAGTDQGLAAFNATTGKLLWRNTKVVNSGSYTAANGVVYLDEGSSLVMLNSSTGAQLGTRQPPSGFQFDGDAIPVDGHIYLAAYGPTGDRLIAYAP